MKKSRKGSGTTKKKPTEDEREYRDRFFRYLFGNADFRELALSLYNALNHSDYDDPQELEFNTLEDTVFLHMKNDASFVIHNEMHVYEQQSSWNPNMVLRELFYYTNILQRDIRRKNPYALFLSKKYLINYPHFYVFYNGTDPKPQEEYLFLSDSFMDWEGKNTDYDDINIQVRVKMININCKGGNLSLLDSCRPLNEYSRLMERIRAEKDRLGISEAITEAIASVTRDWNIYKAVKAAGKELNHMIYAEFDEERFCQDLINQGKEIGMQKGMELGLKQGKELGLKQGKKLGRKEAEKGLAVSLILNGQNDDFIHSNIKSISLKEIAELREDIEKHPAEYSSCPAN